MHARLSPSASARWLNCPGSVILLEDLGNPDSSSFAADEGSVAHELAETCLRLGTFPENYLGQESEHYPGISVNQEMVNGVSYYISVIDEHIKDKQFQDVERALPLFYSPKENGHADYLLIDKHGTLHVFDLKYGKGVKVDCKDNTQQRIYGISAYDELSMMYDIEKVVTHIVQPRLNWVDEEEISLEELEQYRQEILEGVAATEDPLAECVAGDKQCMWCAAVGKCKTNAEFNLNLLQSDFDELDDEELPKDKTTTLTPRQIEKVVQHQGMIKKWLTACQAVVHNAIETGQGDLYPNFKLVEGRSSRTYKDEEAFKKFLKGNFKLDECMPRKLLSLPQAEKLGKAAGKSSRWFNTLKTHEIKPEGKPTLAPASDKRPALVFNEFEGIEDIDQTEKTLEENKAKLEAEEIDDLLL